MKKLLKKLALLPLFCGLVLTSACSNDDSNYELGDRLLPSRSFGEHSETIFSYDNQNRITRIVDRSEYFGEFHTEITYNTDGTIATIRAEFVYREEISTFTYSGNTITRIKKISERDERTETLHFEIDSRGLIIRQWGEVQWDSLERTFIYDENWNVVRTITRWTRPGTGETSEQIINFEHSTTTRSIFRYTTTPAWFFQLFSDAFDSKHGFTLTRMWSDEDNWQVALAYTAENGWVQTMTVLEEGATTMYIEYMNVR